MLYVYDFGDNWYLVNSRRRFFVAFRARPTGSEETYGPRLNEAEDQLLLMKKR